MIGQVLLKFVKLELQVECLLADMAFFPSFPPDFFLPGQKGLGSRLLRIRFSSIDRSPKSKLK